MLQRLPYPDALRGVAILLVVIGHIATFADSTHISMYSYLRQFIAAVNMPLFVLLSGLFAQRLAQHRQEIQNYWLGKLRRLILPALLWIALWTLWHDGAVSYVGALGDRYWFTLHLFLYFIVFQIQNTLYQWLAKGANRTRSDERHLGGNVAESIYHLGCAIALSLLVQYALPAYAPQLYASQEVVFTRFYCLYPYFVVGYLLGRLRLMPYLQHPLGGALSFGLLLLSLGIMRAYQPAQEYLAYGLWSPFRLMALSTFGFLVYTMSRLTEQGGRISRGLVLLGQWSLPIYFTHYFFLPVLPGLRAFLAPIVPDQRLSMELTLYGLGAVITLIPTLATIWLIRSNPWLNMLLYGEKLSTSKAK